MTTEHVTVLQAIRASWGCMEAGDNVLDAISVTFKIRRLMNRLLDSGMTIEEIAEKVSMQ